ncbi:MAG: hypothetical protein AB1468_03490, partial [Candidatus Micrarchaeota archaeon]
MNDKRALMFSLFLAFFLLALSGCVKTVARVEKTPYLEEESYVERVPYNVTRNFTYAAPLEIKEPYTVVETYPETETYFVSYFKDKGGHIISDLVADDAGGGKVAVRNMNNLPLNFDINFTTRIILQESGLYIEHP